MAVIDSSPLNEWATRVLTELGEPLNSAVAGTLRVEAKDGKTTVTWKCVRVIDDEDYNFFHKLREV